MLSRELEDKAQESTKHAKKLAERIAVLGATETGDPTEFVMLSQLKRFSMPSSTSDVKVILSYILEQEQAIIRKYGDFMIKLRDKDDLTYHLLREILEDEIRRESEIEAIINLSRDRGLNSIQYHSSLVVKKMDRVPRVEPTTSASLFQGSSTPYLNSRYGKTATVQIPPGPFFFLHAPRLTTIVKRVLKKPVGTAFESQWKAK